MKNETKNEKFERRVKEYIAHLNNHGIVMPEDKFTDGTNMKNFANTYRKELKKIKELANPRKKNREQINKIIKMIQEKDQELLSQIKNIPQEILNLKQNDRIIFYRNCFFEKTNENTDTYLINNIAISKTILQALKEIYHKCYATYPEKEYLKKDSFKDRNLTKEEIAKLEYLNVFCTTAKWQKEKIIGLTKAYNLTPLEIKNLALKYRYLTIHPEMSEYIKAEKYKSVQISNFLTNQIFATTNNEITNIPLPKNQSIFKAYLNYQNSNKAYWLSIEEIDGLPQSEKAKLIINLQIKSQILQNHTEKQKKLEEEQKQIEKQRQDAEMFKEDQKYLLLFIEEKNLSKKDFCQVHNISSNHFNKIIKLSATYNRELFDKYQEVLKIQEKERFKKPAAVIQNTINNIKTGIMTENGEQREYDLFDYHSKTLIDIKELIPIANQLNLTPEEINILTAFVKKYASAKPLTKKQEKELKTIEHTILDKNGTPHTITPEETEEILNYLKNNNKLLTTTYNIALNKYINGELILEQTKNRKK